MHRRTVARILFALAPLVATPPSLRADPTWRPLEPTSRKISAMTYDSRRGVCVLFGGQDDLRTFRGFNDTWEWNGNRWHERRFTNAPQKRGAHAMAFDEARGQVVLFGGIATDNQPRGDTWVYDGMDWTLAATDGPPPQGFHVMVYDSSKKVVVLVGVDGVWTWDGQVWSHLSEAVPPGLRDRPTAAFDRARKVIVLFAGSDFDRTTFEWNGDEWIVRTDRTGPRTDRPTAITYDSARGVCVLTGVSADSPPDYETWEWDGNTWRLASESKTDPAPSNTLAYDSIRGVSVSFGTHTTEWDGVRWQPRGPGPRLLHAMTYDPARREVLVFGGARIADTGSGNVYFRDLWALTSHGWTLRADDGPVSRYGPSMAYDEVRDVVVMFGGRDATRVPLNDTWEWDGAHWSLVDTNGPVGVTYSSMAYDSVRGVVVMHVDDAFENNHPIADTWEWDGERWSLRDHALDVGREFAKLVYDVRLNRTLAYGLDSRIVWQWDGQQWTETPSTGPLLEQLHSMTYDKERGVAVTLDGGVFPQQIPRTWAWDGESWTRTENDLDVAPRTHAAGAMAYDTGRKLAVFHGGFQARMFGDTWLLGEGNSADFDGDGDIDLADFSVFARCFNGTGVPPSDDCPQDAAFDFDADGDVDMADFAALSQQFTGAR